MNKFCDKKICIDIVLYIGLKKAPPQNIASDKEENA